jgi:hypothetical protein
MNTAMGGAHHSQLGNAQANTHKSGHNQTQQSAQAFAGLINEKLAQTTHKASGSTNVDSTLRFQNSVHSSQSETYDTPLDTESELLQTLRKKLNRLKRSL